MENNMEMAKVITMKVLGIKKHMVILVTTVDPSVTPELVQRMYGIAGKILDSKETSAMPLHFACDYARRQREESGITNFIQFAQ